MMILYNSAATLMNVSLNACLQDSMFGEDADADRKTSITSSFNSTRGDDSRSNRSYSSRRHSETGSLNMNY